MKKLTKKTEKEYQDILVNLENNEERLGKLVDALAGHFEKKLKKLTVRDMN